MIEEILEVYGCTSCPFSKYECAQWSCTNRKSGIKIIKGDVMTQKYPKWCPLKKKSIKITLV